MGPYGALMGPIFPLKGAFLEPTWKDQARSARHLNKENKAKIWKTMLKTFKIASKTWPKIGLLKAFMEPYGAFMEPYAGCTIRRFDSQSYQTSTRFDQAAKRAKQGKISSKSNLLEV